MYAFCIFNLFAPIKIIRNGNDKNFLLLYYLAILPLFANLINHLRIQFNWRFYKYKQQKQK